MFTLKFVNLLITISRNNLLLLVAGIGVANHFVFNRYEPRALFTVLALLIGVPILLSTTLIEEYSRPKALWLAFFTYYFSTTLSILTYRLSPFHSLSGFPGPFLCRITQLWMLVIVKTGKRYKYIQLLHERYGDIVRIGPNELSIRDATAIQDILSNHRKDFFKVPLLIERTPLRPSSHSPSNNIGATLNEAWRCAFGAEELLQHEPAIARRIARFIQLVLKEGEKQNLAQKMNHFAFDIMADVLFGGGYELLKNVDHDSIWQSLEETLGATIACDTVLWLSMIPRSGLNSNKHFHKLRALLGRLTARREKYDVASSQSDLFRCLISSGAVTDGQVGTELALAMIYGSVTISNVLSNVFYFIMRNEIEYKQIQEEVSSPFAEEDAPKESFVNAIIDEVLRLYPPRPGGLAYLVPRGSGNKQVKLGNNNQPSYRFFATLPPDTIIRLHTYTTQRTSRYFSPDPDLFWPDRWLVASGGTNMSLAEDEKFIHEEDAFIPFASHMPDGGESGFGFDRLSSMEGLVKMVVRLTLRAWFEKLEIRFAEGYDVAAWERGLKDVGLWKMSGQLLVDVSPRAPEGSQKQ